MTRIALRQIATAARDLDRTVEDLQEVLGLEIAHIDPALSKFGLRHAVLGCGSSQFFEVVSPIVPTATAARYLGELDDRGYMLIFQAPVAGRRAIREQAAALGYREIYTMDEDGYSCLQWHPRDIGPTMLEIDCDQSDDLVGVWWPAGGAHGDSGTSRVERIVGARVASHDPERDARQWAELMGAPLEQRGDAWTVGVPGSEVVMSPADGDEGLVELTIEARDAEAIRSAAQHRSLLQDDGSVRIAGLRIAIA